jgi:hypothetical protein
VYSKQTPLVPTDLLALFARELRRQSEIHLHCWFAKPHKNKPTQKKIVRLDVVPALPLLLPQKQTHSKNLCLCVVSVLPLLLPQKQTHPKKRRSVWMTGRI